MVNGELELNRPQVERGVSARNPCGLPTLHINSQRKTLLHPTPNIRNADASERTGTVRSTYNRPQVERGVSARNPGRRLKNWPKASEKF